MLMKGFEKLPRDRGGKINRRKPPCLFLVLCWLLQPIWSVLAQETLEAQAIRFRLIPGGWYFVGSPPNETGRYADEAASHKGRRAGKRSASRLMDSLPGIRTANRALISCQRVEKSASPECGVRVKGGMRFAFPPYA